MNDNVLMFFAIIVGILLSIFFPPSVIVCFNYNLLVCACGTIVGIICGAKLAKAI